MKLIKYGEFNYFVSKSDHRRNDVPKNGVGIFVVYDKHFKCESSPCIIKYKEYTKVFCIGREITITNHNDVVFRVTVCDNILRQVYEILPIITYIIHGKQTALIHAAGLTIGNKGYLCVGPSGSGKTTLANMAYDQGIEVLSDELVVYDFETHTIWGTSIVSSNYFGKPLLNKNVPLVKVMCLKKACEWNVEVYNSSKIDKLIEIFNSINLNPIIIDKIIGMSHQVEINNLYFNMNSFERTFFYESQ